MNKSIHDDTYEEDENFFYFKDDEGNKLRFHIGSVLDNEFSPPHSQPGIWIDNPDGSLYLMSPDTFMSLFNYVNRRLDQWQKSKLAQ